MHTCRNKTYKLYVPYVIPAKAGIYSAFHTNLAMDDPHLRENHIVNIASYWIYILHCNNGSYYTGYTTNLTRRYQEHLNGMGSKYTRSFKPLSIAQCWKVFSDKSTAMKIEHFIKQLSKPQKKELILYPEKLSQAFPCTSVLSAIALLII